jgi:AcrR family transcriptional regulator
MRVATRRPEMRETIMDATDRLMERHGYRRVTVDDVAREAGIGKGTIYVHFPSKEELALSCIDRRYGRIVDDLARVAKSAGSPVDRLREMLVERVLLRFDAVQAYPHSLDEVFSALRPSLLVRRERWFAEEAKIIVQIITEGQQLGVFGLGDALTTAQTLVLATNALMPFSLSAQELGAREDIERRARRVAEIVLYGVLPRK